MIEALLVDLDGTLLDIDFDGFMRDYLAGLTARFADCAPPERFQRQLLASMWAMIHNNDPDRTVLDAFLEDFSRSLPLPENALERFNSYYVHDFPRLSSWGRPMPGARELLESAFARELPVVVATAPFYPEAAIRERLRWAGVDDLPFRLITSSEVMHRCKPFPDYYLEIAERIGVRPERCLMVGDETVMDGSAARTGMRVALVGPDRISFTARFLGEPGDMVGPAPSPGSLPRYADMRQLLADLKTRDVL
ncbi:MAG: HAD family phosphatase [Firmicutes bacterium]|nr:HAD family phosphatase [Bacillota bacterium]